MYRFARLCACVLGLAATGILHADPGPLEIWYAVPPNNFTATASSWWQETLPVGNGKLGASVYGGVASEKIQFNEDTVWTGQPHYYENTNSTKANLQTIQSLCNVAAGYYGWATTPYKAYLTNMMSIPPREASYQDAGSIALTFPHPSYSNYRRTLDLAKATVNVHYGSSGVTYNRDVFASAPSNKVIVIRLTASQAGKINFTAGLATQQSPTFSVQGNDVVMHTKVTGAADARYTAAGLTNAVLYDARLRVTANGGTISAVGNSILVTNADEATLYLAVVSNVKNYHDLTKDYVNICSNNVVAASALGYAAIRSAQQQDYTNLFNRVTLDLGANLRTNWVTGARKSTNGVDGADSQFVAIDFQLGRYLMIAGSRPGSEALNLQGKWNPLINLNNQWDSKMTLNINEEENYWGAEICNLSECVEPLMDLVDDLTVTGHRTAGTNYFSDGWVAHHNTDLWRDAAAVNGYDGLWPTGGAWLCQHVWWHFSYTGDTNWLATVGYPMMKEASKFFTNYMITSFSVNGTNYQVACPSYSPEHSVLDVDQHDNCAGTTMDNELLRDLFTHTIRAGQILGDDAGFITAVSNKMSQLPPNVIGNLGQLREWLGIDEGTADAGHRHCSHLVGLFPGDQISTFYTPEVAQAAKVSVDFRGYGHDTPWSSAVRVNLRGALFDGDGAMTNLMYLYRDSKVSTNLVYGDNHDQVDAVFGRLSGIAHMFLASPRDEVILLPALPNLFTNGMVSGLCARGGFQVDNMTWTNGRLTGATLVSKVGNTCRLRSRWPIDVKLGSDYISAPMVAPGLYQFSTIAGSNYTIIPATITETELTSTLSTSGDTQTTTTNAAFSNWRGTVYNANAAADYVSYGVSNVVAGTYRIRVVADAGNNRGQFQLSVGPIAGSLANVGSVQDTYSATNLMYLLPIRINTVTNVIRLWTNQLTEFDCGTWTAPSNGSYEFKFTVAGKNASSSGYALSYDYIRLTPEVASGPNGDPTDIALSNASVTENRSSGAAVGTLSSTDPDAGNTFTYTLVGGAGGPDNGSFSISGSTLQTAASFDYEGQNSYSVRVRTTDQGSLFFEKAFTISVLDTNEAPTDITLSTNIVAENEPAGTAIGTLSSTDVDSASFTYTLVGGAGSTDNGSFSISGDTLQTAAALNYEFQSSYSVRVRSTDAGGLFFEKAFTVNATDVNEPPATPANASPANGAVDLSLAPTLSASAFADVDALDSHAASEWIIQDTNSTVVFDSGVDTVHLISLAVPASTLDYGTAYQWQVRYEDSHGAWSGYSTLTSFTTVTPMLTMSSGGGEVVLSWPTPSTGFSLMSATNLNSSVWDPVSPAPTIWGGFNWVTNPMDANEIYYRLAK